MGSISNTGINNLAQILSLSGAPLAAAAIASPTAQNSLENISAGDLVQLSSQALQLQETSALFGAAPASSSTGLFSSLSTPTSGLNSLLPSLDSSLLPSAGSLADSLAASQTASSGSTDPAQQAGSNSSSNSTSPAEKMAAYVAAI